MPIFSYHLIELSFLTALKGIFSNPIAKNVKGLIHSEYMNVMTLGGSYYFSIQIFNQTSSHFYTMGK
jgi:hypothetical protein